MQLHWQGIRRWALRITIIGLIAFSLPVLFLLPMRWINPPTTAVIQDNLDKLQEDGYAASAVRWQWRDYEEISGALRLAVVASEDQNFPKHDGFDVPAIREAWADRQAGRDFRGASTISQQTVKNLFLWREQSWIRKGLEAWLTGWMEILWPKRRILETYLNIAQFDAHVFGVEAAAQKFFGLSAADISESQAALMVVALPAPSTYRIEAPDAYMLERQAWVRQQMKQLGARHLQAVNRQEDAMTGTTWLVILLVFGFGAGIVYHSWKALRASDVMLNDIDKSKLKDLSKDEWEED